VTLAAALEQALAGDAHRWVELLQRNPTGDPLAAIADSSQLPSMLEAIGHPSLESWLESAKEWKEEQYKDPRDEGTPEIRVFYETWAHLENSLVARLIAGSRSTTGFPKSGGVLCFLAGLGACLVVRFDFYTPTPVVSPLLVIEQPKAAMALWETIDRQPPPRRDALRKILVSGHKLIHHRGVLVHVDRRDDETVFGPSIDTLVMAEILAQDVYEQLGLSVREIRRFLEIGTGSGMLCAGALANLGSSASISGVEMDFGSLSCTHRNLLIANGGLDPIEHNHCTLIGGRFDPDPPARGFDLIVCNPPYIPELSEAAPSRSSSEDYLRAVGGRTLIEQILAALPNLLADEGKLLLMLNNMAIDRALEALPPGFAAGRPYGEDGYPVLFDVEAVFERPAVLQRLRDSGMLTGSGDAYEHHLHPLWIQRERP
jgi:methylase of polypeptide subunit release factors